VKSLLMSLTLTLVCVPAAGAAETVFYNYAHDDRVTVLEVPQCKAGHYFDIRMMPSGIWCGAIDRDGQDIGAWSHWCELSQLVKELAEFMSNK
jgi:hypothetical protein